MSHKLAWGILGTGTIARIFAQGLAQSQSGQLVAVGSRAQHSADAFGELFHVPHCYGSYEALLADPAVEVVYISTPHPFHAEWAIKAAQAGKHILCEKPLALNHEQAQTVIDAARQYDVFLMEAFMYRCHPQTARLLELIRDGAIGKVRVIQATFSFHASYDPANRLFNNALGGGGILDVGCYCTSMARLLAGAAVGQAFMEPLTVSGTASIGLQSRVDEYAVASLTFPDDIIAQCFCGIRVLGENVVRVFGTEGSILVPVPWVPSPDGGNSTLLLKQDGLGTQEISIQNTAPVYTLEADTVACNLHARQAAPPAMTWNDTLGNMHALDMWRKVVGMRYDYEQL